MRFSTVLSLAAAALTFSPVLATYGKQCQNPAVRKEWRDLSDAQKKSFIKAVKCLAKLPHDPSLAPSGATPGLPPLNTSASKFDDFVYAHMDSNIKDHFTGIFFPWHRWFLHAFENALRTQCGYKGTLPFWDWSKDVAHIPNSPLFNSSKTYGLGTFGTNATDYEVTDGAFGTAIRAYPTPHLIKRKFDPYPFRTVKVFPFEFLDPDMLATSAFTPEAVKAAVDGSQGNFTNFSYTIDGVRAQGMHSASHLMMGGDFSNPLVSPNDPLFYLHHAHLDCIWARWQARRPENRKAHGGGLTQDLEHYDQYPVGAPPKAKLSSDLPTVGLSGPVTVEDVIETNGGYLCYKSDAEAKRTQKALWPLSLLSVDHDQHRSFPMPSHPMPHSSNTWPHASLAPGHARPTIQRRDSWTPGSRFDPFGPSTASGGTSTSVWAMTPSVLSLPRPSADLLSPRAQQPSEQDGASPEHISIMLRSLGITPSPAASPAPIIVDRSPLSITPPALSPTTQIMSMDSNSSIHTPTTARVSEPLLSFTPTSTSFDHVSLFNAETPTKARLRLTVEPGELPHSHSRKSTAGAPLNLAPRHVSLALQSAGAVPSGPASPTTSHQRVLSWMQRQGLSSQPSTVVNNTSFSGNLAPAPASHQDWLFSLPRMGVSTLNPLPAWDQAVPPSQPQPQPRPQLQGTNASVWAPRPTVVPTAVFPERDERKMFEPTLNEPINFLRLLQPSSQPPYVLFVTRIVKNSDQQASIFLQQKLKAATFEDARRPIIDAIVAQGFDMMTNRFGNWAIQRCLEAPCTMAERTRVAEVMKGRVVELATNCYGTHVVQKALDCAEDIQLFVVAEMLQGDLATTLMNKHASHVWTKIMELSWTEPAPPIFDYVNRAMQGRWADLARHETGSLIVQHAFENLEESDKADCVREVLESIGMLAVDQWGSWVVQHLLENGTESDRAEAVGALVEHISTLSTDPQGVKAIEKAIKSGGPQAVDKIVRRLSEPAKSGRRPLVVDLGLGSAGSQLISMLLPLLNKAQWTMLYDSVKGHIVTLKGSKSGSRVIWLFERMKSQHGN